MNYKPISKKIIVVGGNAAGPAAAAKAKRTDSDSNVLMFEAGNYISTGTCELPYVLGGVIEKIEQIIFYSPQKFEEEKGVKVFTNHLVETINRQKKTISVRDLASNNVVDFNYDKLILATGSRAKRIGTFSGNHKNVFTLKSVQDLIAIQKYLPFSKMKKALVIGSGYVGIEIADALKSTGCEVILIEKEKYPMPSAEEEIQHIILELLNKNEIEFYGEVLNPKFRFNDNGVKSIEINGWEKEIDFIIEAVGFEPNISLAVSAKLDCSKNGIKVDKRLRTSDPNIYAAGDCVEIVNQINGRVFYLPLATIARDYGHIAGENAAGGNKSAPQIIANRVVKIFEKVFTSVGFNSAEAKANNFIFDTVNSIASNLVKVMPAAQNTFGKIIFEKGTKRILGAQFIGGCEVVGNANLISALIRNKNKLSDLAEINYNYTPPQSSFVNLLSILGRKS